MWKIKAARPELAIMLASVFLLLAFNTTLWQHLFDITDNHDGNTVLRVAFGLIVLCMFNSVLTLLAFKRVLKPLLTVLFILSAAVSYFMSQYGVLIDVGMFRNVAETNITEAQGLLSLKLLAYLVLLGIVPSVILWKTPIHHRSWHRALLSKALVIAGCGFVIGSMALFNYQGLSSLLRNHHELRLMVVPSNYIGASISYVREKAISARKPFSTIAADATLSSAWTQHTRKSLTVLVVGESARADNFGLLGYTRDTTPELRSQPGVIAFSDVQSCGTETAVSVPCMFSNMGRKNYNPTTAKNQESLLDVLKRAGVDVIWRDNQSGCKGTCDRVTFEDVSNLKDSALCRDNECSDEILLQGLQARIDRLENDTVLVLHQMGSHGPEYYKRYPKTFEKFTPICESNALNNCSRESIINSYDNTVVYTDHVLASLIKILRSNQENVDTAMVYLSDHGESLGEYNLFLHGTPYMLAPAQQKHVPMIAWFSENYQASFEINSACLEKKRTSALSQDNLFHSMLGLLRVNTLAYDPTLDIFAGCRNTLDGGALAEQ
ncbi:phosphoethanolamine transferase [Pseudomonas triticifolii]|uniref:Phosphoethanolamine--lipid A transferase n=1 Tax=Pseudomonas triticifolii TaxID=2762592 RepID=A0ABR7BIV6_9PSED|nr:phosphoethanolamine--lipid A transferase [Pseudomonas triticifolii]MBC3957074.1 phosphoethanolamine--lipid A transferase [Pseudomonas triticifolii]